MCIDKSTKRPTGLAFLLYLLPADAEKARQATDERCASPTLSRSRSLSRALALARAHTHTRPRMSSLAHPAPLARILSPLPPPLSPPSLVSSPSLFSLFVLLLLLLLLLLQILPGKGHFRGTRKNEEESYRR